MIDATRRLQEVHPGFVIGFHRTGSGRCDALCALDLATNERYSIKVATKRSSEALGVLPQLIELITVSRGAVHG